ncbi:hypothetical protein GOODEAATRI_005598, partial [Goodea atripinnis]
MYIFLLGSEDGKIHVWNAESGMKVALLDGKHTGPITCLQFNPKFMTFASACSNMASTPAWTVREGAKFGGEVIRFHLCVHMTLSQLLEQSPVSY